MVITLWSKTRSIFFTQIHGLILTRSNKVFSKPLRFPLSHHSVHDIYVFLRASFPTTNVIQGVLLPWPPVFHTNQSKYWPPHSHSKLAYLVKGYMLKFQNFICNFFWDTSSIGSNCKSLLGQAWLKRHVNLKPP